MIHRISLPQLSNDQKGMIDFRRKKYQSGGDDRNLPDFKPICHIELTDWPELKNEVLYDQGMQMSPKQMFMAMFTMWGNMACLYTATEATGSRSGGGKSFWEGNY